MREEMWRLGLEEEDRMEEEDEGCMNCSGIGIGELCEGCENNN